MRYNPTYDRVLRMIEAPEIPRLANGGVALCHSCQRDVYFANGFLELLVKLIETPWKYMSARRTFDYGQSTGE